MNWRYWWSLQRFKFALWWNRVVKKEIEFVQVHSVQIIYETTDWPQYISLIGGENGKD